MGWIDIWLSIDSSWGEQIFISGYMFLIDIIAYAVKRLRDEMTPLFMKLKHVVVRLNDTDIQEASLRERQQCYQG
jgi:hypothetical protein